MDQNELSFFYYQRQNVRHFSTIVRHSLLERVSLSSRINKSFHSERQNQYLKYEQPTNASGIYIAHVGKATQNFSFFQMTDQGKDVEEQRLATSNSTDWRNHSKARSSREFKSARTLHGSLTSEKTGFR